MLTIPKTGTAEVSEGTITIATAIQFRQLFIYYLMVSFISTSLIDTIIYYISEW